jgi:hypothetical protein
MGAYPGIFESLGLWKAVASRHSLKQSKAASLAVASDSSGRRRARCSGILVAQSAFGFPEMRLLLQAYPRVYTF